MKTTQGTGSPSRTGPAPGQSHRAYLDLGAMITAPGCARAWTREILWEWGVPELAEDAEVVVSELVTNSVHACGSLDQSAIRLVLTLDDGELAILVCDDHPGVPAAAQPGADEEAGRGLLIVEHLSDRCGWYPIEGARPAKVTWAVIARPGRPDREPRGWQRPGRLPHADTAAETGPAQPLPARRPQAPHAITGMRAPRLVDLWILARVKAALERL